MNKGAMDPDIGYPKNQMKTDEGTPDTRTVPSHSNNASRRRSSRLIRPDRGMRYSQPVGPYPKPSFIAAVRQKGSGTLKQALELPPIQTLNLLTDKELKKGFDVQQTAPKIDHQTQASGKNECRRPFGRADASNTVSQDIARMV
ncbi:uncharacterized protein Z520_12106 [Fonsecaea multimorphosa CBS 102226]|uniref:Uncharacterized protein n=1 Tax=Fonsecaea multimorphosa CBS 102226 TaxID=1442371 RepID=A0A0D2GRT0_9EURO|nr:uncharacterized protein Z520_12106 [Fonsecaea multimorphosa CBS 102226]KIX92225.1 hypothetical protein Z520_12106 [Fonsecaea multimorphosa CBS 102226]